MPSSRAGARVTITVMDAREEIPLVGGRQTPGIVRVGDTVRRPTGSHTPFVHELLRYLEAVGFTGAPRLLGTDERGRDILMYIEGDVPHAYGAAPLSDAQLRNAASMIRRFHDATAGTGLAANEQVVCHNELGPHNTVFVGDEPVAFIDWDDAVPGTRLFDLANAIWCFVDIGERGGDIASQARRIRLMCDAYGWDDTNAIVDAIHADLLRALANHELVGQREAAGIFREMVRWIEAHGEKLKTLAGL